SRPVTTARACPHPCLDRCRRLGQRHQGCPPARTLAPRSTPSVSRCPQVALALGSRRTRCRSTRLGIAMVDTGYRRVLREAAGTALGPNDLVPMGSQLDLV